MFKVVISLYRVISYETPLYSQGLKWTADTKVGLS